MFKNKFVLGIIGLGILAAVFYMFSSAPTYTEKAEKTRDEYKKSLASMENSPIEKLGVRAMSFFEPNEKWVFEADFIKTEGDREFKVQMTDSSTESSKLAGYATVRIDGKAYNMMVFDEGANYLIPFKDLTNGKETYGGGRYINIEKGQLVGKKLTIDFNNSHNFYCAYDEKFVCPVPPRENHLPVRVEVGELNVKKN